MTMKDFAKLQIGAKVRWSEDGCMGTILHRPDLNSTPPYRVIEWSDGHITDGRDGDAIRNNVVEA